MNTVQSLAFYARHGGDPFVIATTKAAIDMLEDGGFLRAYTYPYGGEVKSVSHKLESLQNLDAMAHLLNQPIYVEVVGQKMIDDLSGMEYENGAFLGQILPDGIILGGILELMMVIGI